MPETATPTPLKFSWFIWTPPALLLFVVIGIYSARMPRKYVDFDQKRAEARYANLDKSGQDEDALLHPVDDQGHPAAVWIDQDKKIVHISIEEAMAREIDTLKAKAVIQGGVIPGAVLPPEPAPAPVAAPPSTNAAPVAAAPPTNAAPVAPAVPDKPKHKKK